MVQVFVGSFFEDREVDKFVDFARAANYQTTGRLMRREKLHLTWLFIGEVDETQLNYLREWLAVKMKEAPDGGKDSGPVEITYDRVDGWPSREAARVLVARPTATGDWVQATGAHLLLALEKLRAEKPQIWLQNIGKNNPDTQDVARYTTYKPHVTLLRSSPPLDTNTGVGQQLINDLHNHLLPLSQTIKAMQFIRSNAGPDRADYEVIAQIWAAKSEKD